jgi:hypothetical protein
VVGDPTCYNTSQIEYLETQSFPIQTIVRINVMETIGWTNNGAEHRSKLIFLKEIGRARWRVPRRGRAGGACFSYDEVWFSRNFRAPGQGIFAAFAHAVQSDTWRGVVWWVGAGRSQRVPGGAINDSGRDGIRKPAEPAPESP